MPSSYDTFVKYQAVKRHFSLESYCYFKYNGKVKVNPQTFENRNDRYYFEKLSRKRNVEDYLVANLHDNPDIWIGDLFSEESEGKALAFIKRKQSLEYSIRKDIEKLNSDFVENFRVPEDSYPHLLNLYLSGEIHIITMSVLERTVKYLFHWNKKITDPVVFPIYNMRIAKMHGFIPIDESKYNTIVRNAFQALVH